MQRVFSGPGAEGNLCQINAVAAAPDIARLPALSFTRGNTWPLQDGTYAVDCYTGAGLPITCCGHGLLAAAGFAVRQRCHEPAHGRQ